MIRLSEIVQRYGDRPLFLDANGEVTYSRFAELIKTVQGNALPDSFVVPHELEWKADSFARFIGLILCGKSVVLGSSVPSFDPSPFHAAAPLLILRTGGTTGQSKHVIHSVEKLFSPHQLEDRPEQRLLVLYAADHIAGIDAFMQALHRGGTLVIPENRDASSVINAIETYQVEVLPATPTFLQFLLLSGLLDEKRLKSVKAIPHGAESMPGALRQRLQAVFPNARLIHRFGLTELGALPVRSDPEDPDTLFLDAAEYSWEVREGELWIKSPTRMLGTVEEGPIGQGDHWHPTGDLAEITKQGSIRILGRREGIINVGGEKVLPETVEGLLLEQAVVLDAAVSGIPNPLTGNAVSAKVVFRGEPDTIALLRSLRSVVSERGLSLANVPTRLEAVQELPKSRFGKRLRHPGKA